MEEIILDDAILEMIEDLAMTGVSDRTICDNLGYTIEEWEEMIDSNEILCSTIESGRRKGIEKVTRSLYEEAASGSVPAAKFFLENRDSDHWKNVKHNKTDLSFGEGSEETALMFKEAIEAGIDDE